MNNLLEQILSEFMIKMNRDNAFEVLVVAFLFSIVFIGGSAFVIKIFAGGVILGTVTAFKFSRDKVGGLVVFVLAIIFITAIIFGLMIGQNPRYINTDLLNPYQLSIYQKLSVITAILYGFILGCATIVGIKTYIKNRKDKQTNGKLVCENCGTYYQIPEGESADDYSDTCECGGKLKYLGSLPT